MKPGDELVAVLQQTIRIALGQWLDKNKTEVLCLIREGALLSETTRREQSQEAVKPSGFLTVAELPCRWRLHPESVRRMIREGRVPRVMVGRQNRVALSTIEALEEVAVTGRSCR